MSQPASAVDDGSVLQRLVVPVDRREVAALHGAPGVDVLDAHRLRVPRGGAALNAYADAFPAGTWVHVTGRSEVRLRVALDGAAEVTVMVSDATGEAVAVAHGRSDAGGGEVEVAVDLGRCVDGGWAWPVVRPAGEPVVAGPFEWRAPTGHRVARRPVVAAVTTFDRPGSCTALLRSLAHVEESLLRRVVVVDQGTRPLSDHPGLPRAEALLGDRLVVHRQANLGGSGGFARGMLAALAEPGDPHVLLLDDDIAIEPETVRRLAALADHARVPTVVGGQMLSSSEPTRLHSFGEVVDRRRFWWGPVPGTHPGTDLAEHRLAATPWMHRRADTDFTGWWTCLVPRDVMTDAGLPLPLFIKWDDAEYGLRAATAGHPTVTLPGAVMWHVPWSDKDDALDWKAYFLHRNRFTAALVHARGAEVAGLLADSFAHQVKHVVSLQYAAAALRERGLRDVLAGPAWLRPGAIGPEVPRAVLAEHVGGRQVSDRALLPPSRRDRGAHGAAAPSPVGLTVRALRGVLHQVRPVRPAARDRPDADLTADDARWWRLAGSDSVVVAAASGGSWTWYVRDRGLAAGLLGRAVSQHLVLAVRWRRLATAYRRAVRGAVRPEAWQHALATASPRTSAGPGGRPADPPAVTTPAADPSPRWR